MLWRAAISSRIRASLFPFRPPWVSDAPDQDQAGRIQVVRGSDDGRLSRATWPASSGRTAAASPTSSTPCAGSWARSPPSTCAAIRWPTSSSTAPARASRWARPRSNWCSTTADGKLGGEYASYSEVSLKRVVSRDGTSTYFLNGARCRRKDITQLFLGTGLGSRSYAIIEQGMISRVIEAKADDMRAFLEEAAGISRTRSGAARPRPASRTRARTSSACSDLRDEVEKQLRHLQRQAATARRYQALKQEERQLHGRAAGAAPARGRERSRGARQAILTSATSRCRRRWPSSARSRPRSSARAQEHDAQSEVLSAVQGRYYQVGAEITRTEQAIQHAREMRSRQRQELEQSRRALQEADAHRVRDARRLAELAGGTRRTRARPRSRARAEEARGGRTRRGRDGDARLAGALGSVQPVAARRLSPRRSSARASSSSTTSCAAWSAQRDRATAGARHARRRGRGGDARARSSAQRGRGPRGARAGAGAHGGSWSRSLQAERGRERELAEAAPSSRGARSQDARGPHRVARGAAAGGARAEARARSSTGSSRAASTRSPRLAQQLSVDTGWERAVETVLGSLSRGRLRRFASTTSPACSRA